MNNESSSSDEDKKIEQLAREARAQRGGKPTKYVHLDQYGEIAKLVAANVQLPFILKWLDKEKNEKIALNTLRKYVIFKIGRPAYDEYLKRNGWLKTKKTLKPSLQDNSPIPSGAAKLSYSDEKKPAAPDLDAIKIGTAEKQRPATVEQLKELTRGPFDPNQFNDDSE